MCKRIRIEKEYTVKELSQLLKVTEVQVVKPLFEVIGIARTIHQRVEISAAKRLVRLLGYESDESR